MKLEKFDYKIGLHVEFVYFVYYFTENAHMKSIITNET